MLLEKYLKEAARVVDELSGGVDAPFTPEYVFLGGLASSTLIALSPHAATYLIGLAAAAALALYARQKLREWAILTAYTAAALTLISLPLLLLHSPQAIPFILRGTSSTAYLAAMTAVLGWRGILDALSALGMETLALDLAVLLRYIPLFLREAAKMLAAREARLVGRQKAFYAVSTVVGGLLLKAYRKASAVYMAMEARSIGRHRERRAPRPTPIDALFISMPPILLLATVLTPW